MNPITFTWNGLSGVNMAEADLDVSLDDANPYIQKEDMQLIGADMNGDGVDDLIRISSVKIPNGAGWNHNTFLYINKSNVSNDGSVSSYLCIRL